MARPICVFSKPVKVSKDEFLTALLKRFPEDALAEAMAEAADETLERRIPKSDRHQHYKAKRFFRSMAERLKDVPAGLALALDIDVEPEELFFDFGLDLPKFDDYAYIFDKWPYVAEDVYDGNKVLVIGYLSGRNRRNGDLIRRNCEVNGQVFKSIDGMNFFKDVDGELHRYIKILKYRVGTKIRCWTNVDNGIKPGDREDLYRWLVCDKSGLAGVINRAEFDKLGPPEPIQRQLDDL